MKLVTRETSLGPPLVPLFTHYCEMMAAVAAFRYEVPVPLNGEMVPCDVLVRVTHSDRIEYVACEMKVGLTDEVLRQCERWQPFTQFQYAVVQAPAHKSKTHQARRAYLKLRGIGLIYVANDAAQIVENARCNFQADSRLIEKAFESGDTELDAAPGSSGVRRQTKAVSKWRPATSFLKDIAPLPASWKFLQSQVPEMRGITSAAAVKALTPDANGNREWLNVFADEDRCPIEFSWRPEGKHK